MKVSVRKAPPKAKHDVVLEVHMTDAEAGILALRPPMDPLGVSTQEAVEEHLRTRFTVHRQVKDY